MIRIVFILLLTIAIFVGFVVFPNVANQPVRIEILGWLLETRTGIFTLLLLFTLGSIAMVQKILHVGINGPKKLWSGLRNGSKKRRELRLQEALNIWIDQGEGRNQKLLKRSKGVVPDWLHESLTIWWGAPSAQPKINLEKDTPLTIAIKARLATEPQHTSLLSLNEQLQYLDAWLAAHPASPLAIQRKAVLLGSLNNHVEQVALLEDLLHKNKSIHELKPLLAQALHSLAMSLQQDEPEHKLPHLRKAHRLTPENTTILIDLAQTLYAAGDKKSSARLLLTFLEHHDAMNVAMATLHILSDEPLKNFKSVDKPSFKNTTAGSWLRINLAHKAELTGLAEDGLQILLANKPSPQLWQMRGDWYAEQQQWQQASEAYQKAANIT